MELTGPDNYNQGYLAKLTDQIRGKKSTIHFKQATCSSQSQLPEKENKQHRLK